MQKIIILCVAWSFIGCMDLNAGMVFGAHPKGSDKYSFITNFGVEQYEDGKKTNHRLQQWWLSCNSTRIISGQSGGAYCSLERLVFDKGITKDYYVIAQHNHDTVDGNLKITQIDWEKGEIGFKIIYTDGEDMDVFMQLAYKNGLIELVDFQAIMAHKQFFDGRLSVIEYKIPKYSNIESLPVEFRGYKSLAEKKFDNFLSTLREDDAEKWQKMDAKKCDWAASGINRLMEIPEFKTYDQGKAEITKEQSDKFAGIVKEEWIKCAEPLKFSEDALKRGSGFIYALFLEDLSEKTK